MSSSALDRHLYALQALASYFAQRVLYGSGSFTHASRMQFFFRRSEVLMVGPGAHRGISAFRNPFTFLDAYRVYHEYYLSVVDMPAKYFPLPNDAKVAPFLTIP